MNLDEAAEQVIRKASALRMLETGELTTALGITPVSLHALKKATDNLDTALANYEKIKKRKTTELSYKEALTALNDLRSNIIKTQRAGWSDTVYPLVAILEAAGFEQFEPTDEQIEQHRKTYGGAGGFPGRLKVHERG